MKIKEFNPYKNGIVYMQHEDVLSSTGYGRKMRPSCPLGTSESHGALDGHFCEVLQC